MTYPRIAPRIADKARKITVIGGLNALLERTVTLRAG
jgi:hypothetical protein